MSQEEATSTFRFLTKKQYEEELSTILMFSKHKSNKKQKKKNEELYEELMDEYLRFCSQDEDAE